MGTSRQITSLLERHSGGEEGALDELLPLVYGELRRMAGRFMARENQGHTLQATALVNEAYFRLVDQHGRDWQNRKHFLGIMGQLMRRVLIDHARGRLAKKRGGKDQVRVPLEDGVGVSDAKQPLLLALDDALTEFAKQYPRASRVVELRYFAGLSNEEVADITGTSLATVKRDWTVAKAWLYREVHA